MRKNPRLIDMAGMRIGMWAVGAQAGNLKRGGALWTCTCDCGTVRAVSGADLRQGKSTCCGCVGDKAVGDRARTHGASATRIYETWQNMRARCSNSNRRGWADYGGRGISVCREWSDFSEFSRWAMASGYADDLTIERVDVDGNYCPDNCTWIPGGNQALNRRFVARDDDGILWLHKARKNGITDAAYRSRLSDRKSVV